MAKVVDAARISTRDGDVWRTCGQCGHLSPLPPDSDTCRYCDRPATAAERSARQTRRERRRLIGLLSGAGISAARETYRSQVPDVLRVAALVEIAGAASTLAREIAASRHLPTEAFTGLVADEVDVYAVLGRGRWLPTMRREVRAPGSSPIRAGLIAPLVMPDVPVDQADAAEGGDR